MAQIFIEQYYKFFDETLQNGTFTVIVIAMMIICLGLLSQWTHAEYIQSMGGASALQWTVEKKQEVVGEIVIDGQIYLVEVYPK